MNGPPLRARAPASALLEPEARPHARADRWTRLPECRPSGALTARSRKVREILEDRICNSVPYPISALLCHAVRSGIVRVRLPLRLPHLSDMRPKPACYGMRKRTRSGGH